jgi:CRP-like cAMP-binding protein/ActR/RegA family two-component response regulator
MKKILLIEDNDDIRSNTAEILELSNYQVITAENGKIGVEKAIEQKPDLIICDIMMPVLDGYGVLFAIHSNDAIKNTPFIFLNAKTDRNDFRKGMEMGADDFISKPFSVTELLNAVESRLKKRELLKLELSAGTEGLHPILEAATGKAALQAITEGRNINKYKKKQLIYAEGNHPSRLYYIIKGKVKAFKINDDGKELVTELFSPGDFLGHVALLEEAPYRDSAEALEPTELAVIPKEDFEEMVYKHKDVSHRFISLLAKNISEKENQLIGIAYNSLRKKVAVALLTLEHKYNEKEEVGFEININRGSLASIAGTATESLIRTLSDFRSEGLVEIKTSGIIILNHNKLEHLAN